MISRGLEIQHLWIDALCIFQEDESDWLEQSSQMSHIYGSSTVTIASVDTEAVSQSFLRPRDTQYVEISWKACAKQRESEQCRNSQKVYASHSWATQHDQLIGPWSKRGWTLQEGLLPSRILFYSSHQIAWKCCRMVRFERGLQHDPMIEIGRSIADEPGGRDFWRFDLFTKFKLLPWYMQSPECHSEHDKYRIWYDMVEDYSARRVKYTRDRLVAISGLAKIYGDVLGDYRYFAGLWQSDMLRGLLWYAQGMRLFDSNLSHPTVVEVKAPSWSWARAPSGSAIRNDWTNSGFRPLAAVKNVSRVPVESNNPFSGVSSTRLTIRGPVYRFPQLYHPSWRSASSFLSAFERHLSCVVEFDYGEKANDFSREGCFAALLLLQEFPPLSHRVDALILKTLPPHEDGKGRVLERLGVLKLSFYSKSTTSSSTLRALRRMERSLEHRLNPGAGPRRSKRFSCEEVFEEYSRSPWRYETVAIV
ncbi:hypothetical protein H2198_003259 [Neophaeococcomyces mojaviensis]|uniref:Uncharacterized protein n=1 Tax=Neophaeococcomyces mojaviensis TaxID=3383035 RepID=A0ACC3ABY1_9EURO|nr:hypothetical protein H2198_003259 [Knufia sp. JES_112]